MRTEAEIEDVLRKWQGKLGELEATRHGPEPEGSQGLNVKG